MAGLYITQPGRPRIAPASCPLGIGQQEHGPGQHRHPIRHHAARSGPDGRRRPVIRIHAHAPGAEYHIHAEVQQFLDVCLRMLHHIIGQAVFIDLQAKGFSFPAMTGVKVSSMRPSNTSVPVVTTPTFIVR